jgi:phage terminase small subunit
MEMGLNRAIGTPSLPDFGDEGLGPAMLACNAAQRRFAMAAVQYPLAKDYEIARAAGYSDFSHGALRVTAHRLFHDEKVLAAIRECADKEIRGSAMLGVATMKKIARLDGHRDQLKAAQTLVGLGGFTIEQRVSVKQEFRDTTDRGSEDRIKLAAKKLAALGFDPVMLLAALEAPVVEGEFAEVKDGE